MKDINTVLLKGRCTRDAEQKYSASGMAIVSFSLAVNDRKKAYFFNCIIFGKYGEAVKDYLTKGKQIVIRGQLTQSRYENTKGKKITKVDIIVNELNLIGNKENERDNSFNEEDLIDDKIPF